MITVTGIFTARHDAERAAETLARLGIPRDRISVLAPGPAGGETGWVGTTEAEAPGVGRVIGGVVGDALDTTLSEGLPKDEVFLYEDALRQGRTVLVTVVDDEAQASGARLALTAAGAETLDAARERWWVGLRDVEAATYDAPGRRFTAAEADYRRGFEAALGIGRGRAFEAVAAELEARYPTAYASPAFRRGFERGRRWDDAAREGRCAA